MKTLALLLPLSLSLSSCGGVRSTIAKIPSPNLPKLPSFLGGRPDIQVVQVNPQAFKNTQNAQAKIRAYERTQRTLQRRYTAPLTLPSYQAESPEVSPLLPPLFPDNSSEGSPSPIEVPDLLTSSDES